MLYAEDSSTYMDSVNFRVSRLNEILNSVVCIILVSENKQVWHNKLGM